MEAIVLDGVSSSIWSSFQHGKLELVPPRLAVRWGRARNLGAPVDGPPCEQGLTRGEPLRQRAEALGSLRSLGASVLERSGGWLASHGYLLLLADRDGIVVHTAGGGSFLDEARRVRLMPGASWSESARGTNAIGTALAEERAVTVVGAAHFSRSFHGLVCYAAPVRGPDGQVVGVLDATSQLDRADPAVGAAVAAAAHAIEESLRAQALADAGASATRTLLWALEQARTPALLIDAPGRVARCNPAARDLLGGPPAGVSVEAALGLSWSALTAEALHPSAGGLLLAPRGKPARLRAEPLLGPSGILAVVVVLEPVLRSPAPPGPPRPRLEGSDPFAPLFAQDPAVSAAVRFARKVAASTLPVMMLAETGSGKELFAQAIHRASERPAGAFVAINCGAIAPGLLESELFGHAPHAFTGADRRGRSGLLHAADRGTLFLDEVAEMAPSMQAALLRFLETGAYQRVGETAPSRADVRVICATCRDLPGMVARGEFRQDLYFRLKGALLRLPPLRERSDLLPMARYLLERLAAPSPPPDLSPEAELLLLHHPWPGNVRELRMALEVALVLAEGHLIEPHHLPEDLLSPLPARSPAIPAPRSSLAQAEGDTVRQALAGAGGNVSAAAARLGVARSTLYRMMRRHGLTDR
jgi:transcriptional regulator of acetoin/glycerol metabolism